MAHLCVAKEEEMFRKRDLPRPPIRKEKIGEVEKAVRAYYNMREGDGREARQKIFDLVGLPAKSDYRDALKVVAWMLQDSRKIMEIEARGLEEGKSVKGGGVIRGFSKNYSVSVHYPATRKTKLWHPLSVVVE